MTIARKLSCSILVFLSFSPLGFSESTKCGDLFEEYCTIAGNCSTKTIVEHISGFFGGKGTRFETRNRQSIAELNKMESPKDTDQPTSLSFDQIEALFRKVNTNNVASLRKYEKYDPQGLGIGFCFGRAMTAHLEALWGIGLHHSAIRKVWGVGELTSGNTNWRYHVTTVVRGPQGKWYAIDPIFGKWMPVEEWYQTMSTKYDPSQSMVLFHTAAKRFGPGYRDAYHKNQLTDPYYNKFFTDLLEDFKVRRREGEL